MNGVSSLRIFSCGLESPPQVLNLNQGVAMFETRGYRFPIPTHYSCPLATIKFLMTFDEKYYSFSESELLVEIDKLVFDDFNATPKALAEAKRRAEAWLSTKKVELSSAVCGNKKILTLRSKGFTLELVMAVFAAIEASAFGSAASPLAVLLCKRGIDNFCKGFEKK